MIFKTLGKSGIAVSAVGLGCNNFGRRIGADEARVVVNDALDAGITLFDTAESYGNGQSEEFLGRALGARRTDVVIATKFGWGGGASARYIRRAVEDSLRRLGTDYIDLYQIHKPDSRTPIAETLEALDALVRAGKVRAIGCSNFGSGQLREALAESRAHGLAEFVTAQNQYSLLERDIEDRLLPLCRDEGVGMLPYYPLASGLLTGKYRRDAPAPKGTRLGDGGHGAWGVMTEANFDVVERLEAYAAEQGRGLLELAIGWLVARPEVSSVIAGARRPGQAAANVRAAARPLTADEVAALDALTAR